MSVYLNTSTIVDGAVLSFMIDANNNSFNSDPSGSVFNTTFTGGDITSNNFTIAVIATQISFLQQPSIVVVSTAMSPGVTVAGTDINGNIDLAYATAITISSDGTLTGSPVTGALASGVATFSTLTHTVAQLTRTLTATSAAWNATSSTFDIVNCQLADNFEDGNLTGWGNTANWVNSATAPISGTKSLQHNGAIDATDYINYVVSCGTACGNIAWQFNMKNGAWDPSSTTKFWFYLSANETTLSSITVDGYAVGVDMSGSTDMITLWKVTNGVAATLITSTVDWAISTLAGIKVTRDVLGQWTLYVDSDGNFDNMVSYGSITNADYAIANNIGLVYTTIASRAGELWLDDFTWTCYPIVVAPEIDVKGNSVSIIDGDATPSVADWTDFGSISTATGTVDKVFTIYNTGTSDLAISGTPKVVVGGANAADFTVTVQPPSATIVTGNSSAFTVQFNPGADGARTATLSIANDDSDENPYNFSIQGTGTPAGLMPGDIAFVEYNADDPDIFAFVVLKDIVAGEIIKFTDNGWTAANAWGTGEGTITWTAPALTCGTVVRITPTVDAPTANFGSCTTTAADLSITTTGDQIIAYQGASTMLAAIHVNALASATWDADGVTNPTSTVPQGLTNTTNCIALVQADNGKYNGVTLIDTKANILAAINNASNWTQSETVNQTFSGSFSITECLPPQSEINISGNATTITDGDVTPTTADHTDFGNVNITGDLLVRTFTIQNNGVADLTISGVSPYVTISGTNAADFSVTIIPSTTIAASGSTSFQITFDPSATGLRTATLEISSNDLSEATYNFSIQGTGIVTQPEMNVKGNGLSIADGDNTPSASDFTDFGSTDITVGSVARSFTIENIADANLLLTNASPYISISGANATDFSVTITPSNSIIPSDVTIFEITFDPNAVGLSTATISISNDDSDENPYNFEIIGTGTILEPEIIVKGNTIAILDEDATPSTTDFTDFGAANITAGTVDKIFSIENIGVADLTLSGVPKVSVSGTNAADFTVTVQPSSPVIVGGSTTFTVRFDPSAAGLRTATISIATNDPDKNPYNFNIQGLGILDAPTTQATNLTFSAIGASTMTVSWTIGNGGNRIVIMNLANSFTDPTNGTDPATNTVYSGAGEQVIYNNSGNTVTITGLTGLVSYWFRVYEYNNSGVNTAYYTVTATNNPLSQSTIDGRCGTETFGNICTASCTPAASSYGARAWTGDDGLAWNATDTRTDQTITTKAITVRTGVLTSPSKAGGIGEITFKTKFPFAETSGTLTIAVNGSTVGTVVYAEMNGTTPITKTITGINLSGNIIVTITNATASRFTIDDLSWTCFVPKLEPSDFPANFACGTTTVSSIPLSWTEVPGSLSPDNYLIKWSSTSYAAITDPVDGNFYADAAGIKNIAYGINSYNVTGLPANRSYNSGK